MGARTWAGSGAATSLQSQLPYRLLVSTQTEAQARKCFVLLLSCIVQPGDISALQNEDSEGCGSSRCHF